MSILNVDLEHITLYPLYNVHKNHRMWNKIILNNTFQTLRHVLLLLIYYESSLIFVFTSQYF